MKTAFNTGDLVAMKDGSMLRSSRECYPKAVVVSVSPFMLVSPGGDMMWRSTIHHKDFTTVGRANEEALTAAFKRLATEVKHFHGLFDE